MLNLGLNLKAGLHRNMPLDDIFNVVAMYSLRQLRSGAFYCMRVENRTTLETKDIGFKNGFIDTQAILDMVQEPEQKIGVGVWYDQSGKGLHAFQTGLTLKPTIYDFGEFQEKGVYFDAINDILEIPTTEATDFREGLIVNTVTSPLDSNGFLVARNRAAFETVEWGIYYNDFFDTGFNKSYQLILDGVRYARGLENSSPNGVEKIYSTTHRTGEQKAYVNGIEIGDTGEYGQITTNGINVRIGGRSRNLSGTLHTVRYKGHIKELILIKDKDSSQRSKIEQNQMEYFNL